MNIYTLMSVVLLLMLQTTANAEVYRCQTSEGEVVFTDKPLNLSNDCKQVKEDSSKGAYSGPPTQNRRATPSKANSPKKKPPKESPEEPDPDSWTSRASTLVGNYNDAVKKRFHESRVLDKQKAIREINKTKEERYSLLEELADSSLSHKQREKVRKILDEIPQ